jgi:hypothetical protein
MVWRPASAELRFLQERTGRAGGGGKAGRQDRERRKGESMAGDVWRKNSRQDGVEVGGCGGRRKKEKRKEMKREKEMKKR